MSEVVYIRAIVLHRDKPAPILEGKEMYPACPVVYCRALDADGNGLPTEFYAGVAAVVTTEDVQKAAHEIAKEQLRRGGFVPRSQR